MQENRSNTIIAITTLVGALLMLIALSLAIGKLSFGRTGYDVTIDFPNAAGITPNSAVKYAGASVGRIKEVKLIPRKDQTIDPVTKEYNCVAIVVNIDSSIEIGTDATAMIKQDGFGISAKYILLTPGPTNNSPLLVDGATMQGAMPFDLSDLVQPTGELLARTKAIIIDLQPVLARLDGLSQKLATDLPPLITNANTFLISGNSVMSNLNTPESRDRINSMIASLRVTSENMKVVSTNAKALTATLAEKPWRVFWGGKTVAAPPEAEVLDSNSVIRLKPDVDVHAAPASTKKKSDKPSQPIN